MSFGTKIDNANFDEMLENNKIVITHFWAPWCNTCPRVIPELEKAQAKHGESIIFSNSNVEEDGMTASKYGVRSLPTVLLFHEGQVVSQLSGMFTFEDLEEQLLEVI